jgi:NADH-quinone oxidoreductase subunit J
MDGTLFILFAAIAVVCAINLVVQKHPINSALSLIGVMGSLAVLYLLLGAEFIAAAQMIVYAGAIMVLFVFTIMLLNAGVEKRPRRPSWMAGLLGIPLLIVLLGLLSFVVQRSTPRSHVVVFGEMTKGGPRDVGTALFTRYLLPFEVTSVLILIAIIGAMVLARKEMD